MQFDPEQALESAMSVFWRKGYEATSLQDLLQVTGLSKSSLYQTFGSKHALFERCLDLYRRDKAAQMREMLDRARSGRAFIERLVYGVAAETRGRAARRGCLVMNTASEFAQSDPRIAKLVKQGAKAFGAVFEAAVVQGQEDGEISSALDAGDLARYLVSSVSGLKTMVKAGATPAEIASVARVILRVLD
jgi:TetR/AcrR family transcriptional repressor of nem operon